MASIVRPLILVLGLMLSGVCCLYNIVDVDKAKPSGETFEIILDVYSGREDPKWEIGRTSPFYKRIARAYKSVPSTDVTQTVSSVGRASECQFWGCGFNSWAGPGVLGGVGL